MDIPKHWIWDGKMLHIDPPKKSKVQDSIERYEQELWWNRYD